MKTYRYIKIKHFSEKTIFVTCREIRCLSNKQLETQKKTNKDN